MPNVELQLKLPGVPDDDCVKLVIVIVPKPATVIVPLPGGSDLVSSQVWPPPYKAANSTQVGLASLLTGIGATEAAWAVAPGANIATVSRDRTSSHDSRRARRERARDREYSMWWSPNGGAMASDG